MISSVLQHGLLYFWSVFMMAWRNVQSRLSVEIPLWGPLGVLDVRNVQYRINAGGRVWFTASVHTLGETLNLYPLIVHEM